MSLTNETKTNFLGTNVKMLYFDSPCVCILPTMLKLSPGTCDPRSRCLENTVLSQENTMVIIM